MQIAKSGFALVCICLPLVFSSCKIITTEPETLKDPPPGTLIYSGGADNLSYIGVDSLFVSYTSVPDPPIQIYHVSFIFDIRAKTTLSFKNWNNITPIDIRNGFGLYPILGDVAIVRDSIEISRIVNVRDASFNEDASGVVFARSESLFVYFTATNLTMLVCTMPNNIDFIRQPVWRRDTVVFCADSAFGYGHIYSVSAKGGTPVKLTFGPYRDARPRLSATNIAFLRTYGANRVIILSSGLNVFNYAGNVVGPEIHGDTLFYCGLTTRGNGVNIYMLKWR